MPNDFVELKPNAHADIDLRGRCMVVSHQDSEFYVCKVPCPCRTGTYRFEDIVEEGTGNVICRGEVLGSHTVRIHKDELQRSRRGNTPNPHIPTWRRLEYDASMKDVKYFLIFGIQRTKPKIPGVLEGAARNVGFDTHQEMEDWCEQRGAEKRQHYYLCGKRGFTKIKDFQIPLSTPQDQMKYVVGFVNFRDRDAFLTRFRSSILGYVKVQKADGLHPDGCIFEGMRVMKGLSWGWGSAGSPCFDTKDERWDVGGKSKTRFEGTVVDKAYHDGFGWMVKVQWDTDDADFWYRAGYSSPDGKQFFSDLFIALGPDPKPEFFKPRLDAEHRVNTLSFDTEPRSLGMYAEERRFTTQ
jgi:hypothetical protein